MSARGSACRSAGAASRSSSLIVCGSTGCSPKCRARGAFAIGRAALTVSRPRAAGACQGIGRPRPGDVVERRRLAYLLVCKQSEATKRRFTYDGDGTKAGTLEKNVRGGELQNV